MACSSSTIPHRFETKALISTGSRNIITVPASISVEEVTLALTLERLAQKLSAFSSSSFYLPLLVGLAGAGVSLHGLEFCIPFAIGALVAARLMSVAVPEVSTPVLDSLKASAAPINESANDKTSRTADQEISGNSAFALNASDY